MKREKSINYFLLSAIIFLSGISFPVLGQHLYISPNGNDRNPGTKEKPLATLLKAKEIVRELKKSSNGPIKVILLEGTYYMDQPLVFQAEDSGSKLRPIIYTAEENKVVTISGGKRLQCEWKPFKDGIWKCELPAKLKGKIDFDQLFVNGKRMTRARFPNYDISDPGKSGYTTVLDEIPMDSNVPYEDLNADMTYSGAPSKGVIFNHESFTKKKWQNPGEAIIHILVDWGNLQWRVKQIDWDKNEIWFGEGGWQIGAKWYTRPTRVNKRSRFFIENVFEELDAPGEWYLDKKNGILYFYPPEGLDIKTALVEYPVLKQIIQFQGTQDNPVQYITLNGFRFAHMLSTFLDIYEIPSLSDWAVHRGGAVFFEGAHHCNIKNCWFDAVGGTGVFINKHNRDINIYGSKFTETGESGICLVGALETTNGTRKDFPYECKIENNLMHHLGYYGKQVAGVYISRAKRITVSHNLIHDVPRAAICIGDGTWGGHIIEFNHTYNTCQETADHGPFNAWGRDRYWSLLQSHPYKTNYRAEESIEAGDVLFDAMEPTIVRNNFFEDKKGWGLNLDDGASNYEIYNNICVGVSMKLREGAYRNVYNNIWVNGVESPCFHVGNEFNHDCYHHNITVRSMPNVTPEKDLNFDMDTSIGEIYTLIAPPAKGPWLEYIDYNLFYSNIGKFIARVKELRTDPNADLKLSLLEWQKMGFDIHSIFADPMFVDLSINNYNVKPESPALKLGFKNFEMGKWGLKDDFPKIWKD